MKTTKIRVFRMLVCILILNLLAGCVSSRGNKIITDKDATSKITPEKSTKNIESARNNISQSGIPKNDTVIQYMQKQLVLARVALARLENEFFEEWPEVKNKKKEIESLEKQISDRTNNL